MPQLLIELFSEEIPARMQAQAARDFERMARERLADAGFLPEGVKAFAGPRRLTLVVDGLAPAQADRAEERRGPRANAPEAALQGFLRSTGLTRDQLVERDGFFYAVIQKTGRPTPQIVAEMVEQIVRGFPWPKSMTWGTGSLRWVRPLQRILCVFDGEVVPFEIDGIQSGNKTEGHRFMGSKQTLRVRNFDEYDSDLVRNFVMLDAEDRKARIRNDANAACFVRGLELVEDEGLLDEVSGLCEWPTVIVGDMDPAFLDLPPEVIRTSMRTHQKYFAVRYPTGTAPLHQAISISAGGTVTTAIEGEDDFPTDLANDLAARRSNERLGKQGLAPHFITVANIEAADGGALIAAGNARVLSARLNDARFFWDEDRKVTLESRLEKLKGVTFHAKLGTMYERVERIEALAREIAPNVGADPDVAAKAARLAKADLGTGMVGEFPELQGLMGSYYARKEGLSEEIAHAIRDHYKPQGPSDTVPSAPTSVTLALADKLDTLVAFFAIGEKPTGSKDPYALRRAALGVIRTILDSKRRDLRLSARIQSCAGQLFQQISYRSSAVIRQRQADAGVMPGTSETRIGELGFVNSALGDLAFRIEFVANDLLAFFADRLKVLLREQGKRHDLVDAVFALGDDDLVRIVDRVEALDGFLKTEDGANLLAGYRRASNILKAEEKKDGAPVEGEPAAMADAPPEETGLLVALQCTMPEVEALLDQELFERSMKSLASLRAPVDAFFEKVLVNADNAAVRQNRLRLLAQVRAVMGRVADFSLIAG